MAIGQSLFKTCLKTYQSGESGTYNIGGTDIYIERYSQKDIDNKVALGTTDQNRIVLICDNEITIPSGRTITPSNPKKSLVFLCNKFTNNGTISMISKAPNVVPHNYTLLLANDRTGIPNDIIIPAYANNSVGGGNVTANTAGTKGNNGTNRNCGSGGSGATGKANAGGFVNKSGSGYAFGGGAGSGASYGSRADVNATYPMRGGNASRASGWTNTLIPGVGNPGGTNDTGDYKATVSVSNGCGGRVIIFCNEFENNGTITVNGSTGTFTNASQTTFRGGASGAGAIDIFYTTLTARGTTTANGGSAMTGGYQAVAGGAGGNGSITLSQWTLQKVVREQRKKFTQPNWLYLFSEYASRLSEDI